ncbi:MAG: family 20 glycosylhydrolase [Saprospiraceae bacterium]
MKCTCFFIISCLLLFSCNTPVPTQPINLIPQPLQIVQKEGTLSFKNGFDINVKTEELKPLAKVLRKDFYLLTGINKITSAATPTPVIQLNIDKTLAKEAYQLSIDRQIKIKGGSYGAVAMGVTTLWQLMNPQLEVPKLEIKDEPANNYRSLMVDIARAWHDLTVLEELIVLCQWYKINYLHLHLTDDQSITFPSTAYPKLATEGRQYTKQELVELNEFAYERGVILVPEIDVPGHSSEFIKNRPDLFGIQDLDKNRYTINIGKEATYQALDVLLGEIATVFTHSPYIHIGGDEAFFDGLESDAEVIAYMKAKEIPTIKELFRHFIVRLNTMVQQHGKQTIVWAGFAEKGEIEIPKDIIVMLWEPQYYAPEQLEKDGYKIINASWKPLYVVNNRKWSADYIYEQWNPRRWESWTNTSDFIGPELKTTNNIIGATMCAWEQHPWNEIHRLRKRIPAMNASLWGTPKEALAVFQQKLATTDAKLSQLLRPFAISLDGLTYPDWQEGNYNEHLWFTSDLTISLDSSLRGTIIKYSLDNKPLNYTATTYTKPIKIDHTTTLKMAAFDEAGKLIGHPLIQKYFHQPLTIIKDKLVKALAPNSWEKHRFEKSLNLRIISPFPNSVIKYTLDGSPIKKTSPIYTSAINVQQTTHLTTQLFDDAGAKIGSPLRESYYLLKKRSSLTTNKPTTASNEALRPGLAKLATNGNVTLWEQWGDHNNGNNWIQVDLEKTETVSKFKVYNFWDNYRYYQYSIEGSLDGENWETLVDFSENTEIATNEGYAHDIAAVEVRYLKLKVLYNSANPGLHVVEFSAY